ncbi:helix-turn-helix transcriptional regulator [Leptobacterium sp. I13]|uniref:helix-turn-helix domain-containing protein n=1 Tax=Leptobacterium meishanense TaxID=3128904 RepID=UPI0030EEBC33
MDRKEELKKFGDKIKEVRESKGLTQSQLAHKINKDRESIARLERGGINPTFLYLKEVCEGLEMTLAELFNQIESQDES